jgi:TetR/AcrR family transcriptional repressor of nem operon
MPAPEGLRSAALPSPVPGDTRQRLLDAAQSAILSKGFAATSIEEIIAAVGITKSGFFYHFADKGELAHALLERYLERERVLFDEIFARADELSEDPLHGFLIALKMFEEIFNDLPHAHPGCLTAAFCYQDRQFDKRVRELNTSGIVAWRERFRGRLQVIVARYPPRMAVDLTDVADMLSALADGGIILSKALDDPKALPRQIRLYREFIRALFLGTPGQA